MSTPRKANALREQGARQNQKTQCNSILHDLLESIKTALLSGRDVRLIDFLPDQRSLALAAIAQLRDELPIRTGWQTIRESHLSETRLRARRYSIPGEFLREVGDE